MTNEYIMKTALMQSAIDSNCDPQDFLDSENKVFISKKNPGARKYLELPYVCDFTSYGNNIVISSSTEFAGIAKSYADRFSPEHCFETPAIHLLGEEMRRFGMDICFMAEYFLPDTECFRILPCKYRTEIICGDELKTLYLPEWSNALCEKRKELDVLAVGAYDREKLIGLVGEGIIDYVAMDIKNSRQKYAQTAGVKNIDLNPIEKSIEFLKSGKVDFEFRTTVVKEFHVKEDFKDISDWIGSEPKYFLQKFVDSGDLIESNLHGYDDENMKILLDFAKKHFKNVQLRGV